MPKEVRFPIRIDGLNDLEGLVSALKKVKAAADDANKSGATGTRAPSAKQTFANLGIPSVPYVSPKPPFIEIDKMMPKAGRIGGGSMGSLGMGAAAGATAAGVLMLGKVMKEMVQQSKIANTLQKNANKAMGLLVDLVLLPFLPLLVFGIINLYSAVLYLGKKWAEYVKNPVSLITTNPINDIGQALLGPIGFEIGRWIGENYTDKILSDWQQTWTKVWKSAQDTWSQWVQAFNLTWADWSNGITEWWTGLTSGLSKAWDDAWKGLQEFGNLVSGFFSLGWLQPWIDAFWAGLQGWLDAFGTIPELLNQALLAIQSGAKAIANAFIGLINWILDSVRSVPILGAVVPADLPYLDTGGFVKETGVAVVHKGETVTPAGASSSGNTYNFYGYDDKSLQSKVKSIIRQEGTRYML